jgi:hypothetical protein
MIRPGLCHRTTDVRSREEKRERGVTVQRLVRQANHLPSISSIDSELCHFKAGENSSSDSLADSPRAFGA